MNTMMREKSKERIQECRDSLARFVHEGDTVFCVLRKVSASGMSRKISLHVAYASDYGIRLQNISGWAAAVMGRSFDRDDMSIKIGGCGMDMGFALVDDLAVALFGREPKTGLGKGLRMEWV